MNIEPVPWHSNREVCPADFDLQLYIDNNVTNRMVFILGPGYDHLVGKNAHENHNLTLAMTHSPGELSSYMSWAIENPSASQYYQCMFGDVHLIDPRLVKAFRVTALLHLGERFTEGYRSIEGVIDMFRDSELLICYTGSFAWPVVAPVVSAARSLVEQYNSLAIYQ